MTEWLDPIFAQCKNHTVDGQRVQKPVTHDDFENHVEELRRVIKSVGQEQAVEEMPEAYTRSQLCMYLTRVVKHLKSAHCYDALQRAFPESAPRPSSSRP